MRSATRNGSTSDGGNQAMGVPSQNNEAQNRESLNMYGENEGSIMTMEDCRRIRLQLAAYGNYS
jgi:hypothetical protein